MRFVYYFIYLFVFLVVYLVIVYLGRKLFKVGKEDLKASKYPLIKLVFFFGSADFFGWLIAYLIMVMFNGFREISDASLKIWTNFIYFDILHLAFLSLSYIAFKKNVINKIKRVKLFLLCYITAAVIETILLYIIL